MNVDININSNMKIVQSNMYLEQHCESEKLTAGAHQYKHKPLFHHWAEWF